MPELPRYTASGQIRSGPVAAPPSVLDAPARAVEGLGHTLHGVGQDVGQIAAQRQKEDDLRWSIEVESQYKRTLAERNVADSQNPRETEGPEFKDFADQTLNELMKTAPSKRAADIFRSRGLDIADARYNMALQSGEQTRLVNSDRSNTKAVSDSVEAFRLTNQAYGPDIALPELNRFATFQLASIEERFGKTAPKLAEKMRLDVVANITEATAPTHPDYARSLVRSSSLEETQKASLLRHIDTIERNANETTSFNLAKAIDNSIAVGYETLTPVTPPSPAAMKVFPQNQQERINHELKVANSTISQFSKIKSWNWAEQQKAIQAIDIKGDPVAEDVRAQLAKLTAKSQEQQLENPAGWQLANDPEFTRPPATETDAARMARLGRMVALQGPAPIGTDSEQAKRYLNLPTGLQKASSAAEAEARAATLNNSQPNALAQAIDDLKAQVPDARIAGMVWNDMQNLPAGKRLRMGIRVAGAIEDKAVRSHFLGMMFGKDNPKTAEPQAAFERELIGREQFTRFRSGWNQDNNQRSDEAKEFEESIIRYAMHISSEKNRNLSASKSIDIAVSRVITENYGMMNVNGLDVPVYRFTKAGRYSDGDLRLMEAGIRESLFELDVSMVSTDRYHFPLQPNLPGDQSEATRYLQNTIRSTGTVVVEPDGASATVYAKGDGVNDIPFQLRGADGLPLVFDFENMKVRGQAILSPGLNRSFLFQERMHGADVMRLDAKEQMKADTYRRMGIDPKTGYKVK